MDENTDTRCDMCGATDVDLEQRADWPSPPGTDRAPWLCEACLGEPSCSECGADRGTDQLELQADGRTLCIACRFDEREPRCRMCGSTDGPWVDGSGSRLWLCVHCYEPTTPTD